MATEEYIVSKTDMTSVADKIRAKGGTSDPLEWPGGWEDAVDAIPTGGSTTEPYIEETYDEDGRLAGFTMHGYTKIRESMFSSCNKLVLDSLPDEIKIIEAQAFYNCIDITLKRLPNCLQEIGGRAFHRCRLMQIDALPEYLEYIGEFAFNYCTSLTEITFQGTPNSIANNAFANCTNLAQINVPWAEGEVANAPWGATNATITYNYTEA